MSFYTTVIYIGFVVLLICLVMIGVMLSYPNNSQVPFPPFQNACPDFWQLGKNGTCLVPSCDSGLNLGTLCAADKLHYKADSKVQMDDSTGAACGTPSVAYINPAASMSSNSIPSCSLKDWATTYGISWNGASNNNQC